MFPYEKEAYLYQCKGDNRIQDPHPKILAKILQRKTTNLRLGKDINNNKQLIHVFLKVLNISDNTKTNNFE